VTTTSTPVPADYSDGYGELVRAYRQYLGISQRTLSNKIGIAERSLSDIEIGRRRCPRGFINSVEKVVDEYDAAVEKLVEARGKLEEVIWEVTDDPRKEWDRAVIGRAGVVTGGVIRPVLVSQQHP
jgi:transcriptional regulator with XRE-family HTH domain